MTAKLPLSAGTIIPMGMITRLLIMVITIMVTMNTIITTMIITFIITTIERAITTIERAAIPACSTAAPTRPGRRSPA